MVFVGVNVDHAELSKWVMRARAERAIFKIVDNSIPLTDPSLSLYLSIYLSICLSVYLQVSTYLPT